MITVETSAANANVAPSRGFLERQAFEAFKAFVFAFQRLIESPNTPTDPVAVVADMTTRDVMTADEVAEFLGVDRNTVYDFASRGVIPHQRPGKRLLFRYYDPRVLRVFLPTCTPAELAGFFGPIRGYLLEAGAPETLLRFGFDGHRFHRREIPLSEPIATG